MDASRVPHNDLFLIVLCSLATSPNSTLPCDAFQYWRSPGCTTVNLTTTLPPLSFALWSDTSGYAPNEPCPSTRRTAALPTTPDLPRLPFVRSVSRPVRGLAAPATVPPGAKRTHTCAMPIRTLHLRMQGLASILVPPIPHAAAREPQGPREAQGRRKALGRGP